MRYRKTATVIKMARRFVVGGNWKMNGDKNAINLICRNLVAGPLDPNTEVVIGCPAVYIEYTRSLLPPEIGVAGQVSKNELLLKRKKKMNIFFFRTHTKYQVVHSPVKYRQHN